MTFKILPLLLLNITNIFAMGNSSKMTWQQILSADTLRRAPETMTIEEARNLIACGYDLDAILKYHWCDEEQRRTPLTCLVGMDDKVEVIKIFARGGADVNKADKWGDTPLITAAIVGRVETVRTLLDGGADRIMTKNDVGLNAADLVNGEYHGLNRRSAAVSQQIAKLLTQVVKIS